jgi:hypothetical protein
MMIFKDKLQMMLEKDCSYTFSKVFLFPSLIPIEMEGCELGQLEIKGHKPTQGEFQMGVDMN